MDDVTVVFAAGEERYEIRKGQELVGYALAVRKGGLVTMSHVEIAPEHRGNDLATRLVRAALEDVDAKGERVVARCPFVVAFLRRYPRYRHLQA